MRRLGSIVLYYLGSCRKAIAVTIALALLVCGARISLLPMLAGQAQMELGANPLTPPHLGDVLLWVLGAINEVARPPAGLNRTEIPLLPYHWLIVVLLPSFLLTYLPVGRDGFEQVLVAGGSRLRGWLASAAAGVLVAVGYWLVVFLACVLATVLLGGTLTFEACEWTAQVSPLNPLLLKDAPYNVLVPFMCCVAASAALALAQLSLQLWCGASVAWVLAVVQQFASLLFFKPLLPGNLMMMGRSSALIVDHTVVLDDGMYHAGLEPHVALVVATVLAAVSLAAGSLRMRRDVLRKD